MSKLLDVTKLSEDEQSRLVEDVVCRKIHSLRQYPLDQDTKVALMNCIGNKGEFVNSNPDLLELTKTDGMFKMVRNRLELYGIKVSNDFVLMCYFIFRTPGEVSMMAAYIAYQVRMYGKTEVLDIFDWTRIFEYGYYNQSDLQEVWDSQKFDHTKINGLMDNLIDYKLFNKSLMR